nr:glycosyltransferase [Desulfobulbaceae bacterium]
MGVISKVGRQLDPVVSTTGDNAPLIHVLFVLHSDPLEGSEFPPGGVELHVKGLAEELAFCGEVVPIIWASNGRELSLIEIDENGDWCRTRLSLPNPIDNLTITDSFYTQRFQEVLQEFQIDIIHVHHLFRSPLDISSFLGDWSGGLVISLHDYFFLCPGITLIGQDGSFCKGGGLDICPACVKKITGRQFDIQEWRGKHRRNVEYADLLYAPSESTASLVKEVLKPCLIHDIVVRG